MSGAKLAEQFNSEDLQDGVSSSEMSVLKGMAGEQMTLVHVRMKKGFVIPMHSHHHEQVYYIVSGRLLMTYEEQPPMVLEAGQFGRFPPHVAHQSEALEDSETVEVFGPARNELLRPR